MTKGIFALSFESDNKQVGSGFAVFADGKIRGGDADFVYDGVYQIDESTSTESVRFTAKVTVQFYKGINLAIFGKMTRFPIVLSGDFTSDKLFAHGEIKKFGNEDVDLNGTKIDDYQLGILESFIDRGLNTKDQYISDLAESAFDSYRNGRYVDATNSAFLAIKSMISFQQSEISNDNINDLSLSEKIKKHLQILTASDKVLDKKLGAPEDCAFPLCILAFNALEKLLE